MLSMLLGAGLAVAVDMLVTGGEIKLVLPAMLGLLDFKTPELVELLDGARCVAFMSAVLLDCLLYGRTAAFMQGPLLHFLRGAPVNSGAPLSAATDVPESNGDPHFCSVHLCGLPAPLGNSS